MSAWQAPSSDPRQIAIWAIAMKAGLHGFAVENDRAAKCVAAVAVFVVVGALRLLRGLGSDPHSVPRRWRVCVTYCMDQRLMT
jgi:hypothetical protein